LMQVIPCYGVQHNWLLYG